jgi:hypothetical protein
MTEARDILARIAKLLRLAGSDNPNAVPVAAAQAIAETILTALLASKLGGWRLSSEGVWVRGDARTGKDLEAGAGWEAGA